MFHTKHTLLILSSLWYAFLYASFTYHLQDYISGQIAVLLIVTEILSFEFLSYARIANKPETLDMHRLLFE